MTRDELGTRIRAIISDHMARTYVGDRGQKEVADASRLIDDLTLDGLDLIEIRFEIEDAYDIELKDEDVEHLTTVADVIAYVAGVLGLSGAEAA